MFTLRRTFKNRIFGRPFEQVEDIMLPVVQDCCHYIRTKGLVQGIFRMSASIAQINSLKKKIDQGKNPNIMDVEDPHVVACFLKLFLRELPDPLLTSLMPIHQLQLTDEEKVLKYIGALNGLEPSTLSLLLPIFKLLTFISLCEEPEMNARNLAVVLGPNLIKINPENPQGYFEVISGNALVAFLIQHGNDIFPNIWGKPDEDSTSSFSSTSTSTSPQFSVVAPNLEEEAPQVGKIRGFIKKMTESINKFFN